MIIVKLQGGLGNQMFQYALGRHLSVINNVSLKLDTSAIDEANSGITKRKYGISVFKIKESFATKKEIAWFKKYHFKNGKIWFWYNRIFANRARYAWETRFNFDPWIMELKDPFYLDGYWQTEKYFKNIEDIIRKEYTLRNPLGVKSNELLSEISKTESVSLHVRRGDYVSDQKTNDWLGVCSVEYYNKAIETISARVKNPHFFVFSDDPVWAKENITPSFATTYASDNHNHPEEDMFLMSKCKHNIIANSSFSWWGAWLNINPEKIVIAPRQWYKTQKMDTRDIIPDTWVKI
ncbi:MAG: alpha-1,2-fucosyltransferase [bacterium]|nr:alpha-1,2-fucosyltransferase [bacterium]